MLQFPSPTVFNCLCSVFSLSFLEAIRGPADDSTGRNDRLVEVSFDAISYPCTRTSQLTLLPRLSPLAEIKHAAHLL